MQNPSMLGDINRHDRDDLVPPDGDGEAHHHVCLRWSMSAATRGTGGGPRRRLRTAPARPDGCRVGGRGRAHIRLAAHIAYVARRRRLPTMCARSEWVAAGCLLSYATNRLALIALWTNYAD